MLQAKSNKGRLITLASLTKVEIEQLRLRQKDFFCPTCNNQVIIKAGSKMIPHFAHRSRIDCPSHETGEGEYHERGKLLLYQWLKSQQLNIKLEAHIPEINQRPDLLLEVNGKRIAFEYQCARIPIEQIKQRNEGYQKAGITPIWIIGAIRLKRQTKNHLKIDQFTLHLAHQFSSNYPLLLFYFCPHTLQFITVQDLYFTKIGQAIGKMNVSALNQINLQAMFSKHQFAKSEVYLLWKKEKQQFRLKQRNRLYGKELAWHQWLYLKGLYLEHLPSIIHLPIASQYRMNTPTWNWQGRLCVDLLHPIPIGSEFSIKSCEQLLRKHIQLPETFPLISPIANPVEQYLQHLVHLDIIKQLSPNHYQKKNAIHFHENIEKALVGDETVMNQLHANQIKQNTGMF